MNWLAPWHLTSIPLLLFCCMPLQAQHPSRHPLPRPQPTHDDVEARRNSIHRELDANEAAVKRVYQLLDSTPEAEVAGRRFLESQIQQFDDRSEVLFENLEALDRRDFEQNRYHDLKLQANRLEEEARQLRRSGHVMPAALREAKAKSIRISLSDGTWKLLVGKEWNCQDDDKHPELGLLTEVRRLKSETAALREEMKQLRHLVEKLTKQKHPSARR